MSTVDTHLNWGASYLANDVYKRFLDPGASEVRLLAVSRFGVVALAAMGVLVASRIDSIEQAWRFFVALGAGLGLPSMLRWLWWRANAWTEIAGLSVAVLAAAVLYALFPAVRAEYLLLAIVALSTIAALVATWLTPPVPQAHLQAFVDRVRPPGCWRGMRGAASHRELSRLIVAWVAGNAGLFATLFGIGHLLLGRPAVGAVLLLAGLACLLSTLKIATRHGLDPDPRPETASR